MQWNEKEGKNINCEKMILKFFKLFENDIFEMKIFSTLIPK
jgi:hypothetical protein